MTLAHLADRAVVSVTGPDAFALLHNVLTLDMPGVDRHGSGYGALLTPQGKILWDFILHRTPDGYAADLRVTEVEAFAKRLALYRLRAKVDIAATPDLGVYVQWPGSPSIPLDPRLPLLGSRWLAPAGSVATDARGADWHRHRIALAVPEGGLDFAFGEAFPHDAAMDSLHGLAFEKGCYIGQEVVSRMRHRGTARRRIVALRGTGPWPDPGVDIVAGDRAIGRLGSSAGDHGIGLVRLDRLRTALDSGIAIRAGDRDVSASLPAGQHILGRLPARLGRTELWRARQPPLAPGSGCSQAAVSICSIRRRSMSKWKISPTVWPASRAGTDRP
jgi:folate-binding protein YgfZ